MNALNHVAVVVAAVAHWIFGALWYGMLSSQWVAAVGKHAAQSDPMPYIISIIALIVVAYAFGDLFRRIGINTLASGAKTGAVIGIAIVAAYLAVNYAYQARPLALWVIDGGYAVIGAAIIGAVIGGWRKR